MSTNHAVVARLYRLAATKLFAAQSLTNCSMAHRGSSELIYSVLHPPF